jgi:HlyD family secretion protein
VSIRSKFLILLGIIFAGALTYYLLSTSQSKDLVLIGTVDANQVIVSPKITGRIEKLVVDEGTDVKEGDLIALLDTAELQAQERAASATINSLRSKVSQTLASEAMTKGVTSSGVVNAQARLQSAKSQLASAEADLVRIKQDNDRTVALADQGVASQQDKDRSLATLQAQQAKVQAAKDEVRAAQADLESAQSQLHQQQMARNTVASTRADMASAAAQQAEAEARLGYTRIVAPVSGTVSVRAAREGEVVNPGSPIVTIVDLNDSWVRASIPETQADHIAIGDTLKVQLPSGETVQGKVFFKAVEGDYATQRDVSRRKRDIKTVALKVRIDNSKKLFVPGMTAEVLVPQSLLKVSVAERSAPPAIRAPQSQDSPAAEERH